MAFWGIEVKPGSPYTHLSKICKRRLHISQATLGIGSGTNKSLVQCNVGDKYPVFLCALLPGKNESCGLDLEFEEADDVVFSVIGPRSVHLTGYYLPSRPQIGGDDESESYGEDIANSENELDHGSEDDDYEDSFIDDGDVKDRPISIDSDNEETAVSKPKKKKNPKRLKKKFQTDKTAGIDVSPQNKPVPRRYCASVVDSDNDDDDLPLSSLGKEPVKESNAKLPAEGERQENNIAASDDKEKIVSIDQETTKGHDLKRGSPDETDSKEGPKTKKRKKEQKAEVEQGSSLQKDEKMVAESKKHNELQSHIENGVNQPEMKIKKSKKKKHKLHQDNNDASPTSVLGEKRSAASEEIKGSVCNPSASKTRTLSSGLIIEELEYGDENAKVARQGKKVKINYSGKLKTGPVVESNSKGSPYKFRLGAGKVIKAWDIGIEGMRVGGKRRLTIPPALGYGSQGNGENIPPDSWLVYDIELISAR